MSLLRIMLFSFFLVLTLLRFGFSQPYTHFYSFQVPPRYSGFVMNMNPDGTQTVKYLTDAEAEAMAHEQHQHLDNIITTNMNFINRIFDNIPFPKFPKFPATFPFFG